MRTPFHRGHQRFPWSAEALAALRELAGQRRSYRELGAELERRRLVRGGVDPATIRRAVRRLSAGGTAR